MRLDSIRSLGRDLLDRNSPPPHEVSARDAQLEGEVRELIYGPRTGSVARRRSAGERSRARKVPRAPSIDGADTAGARPAVARARPPREVRRPETDSALEAQLAAALLGELDGAARERALRHAAAKLSKNVLEDQRPRNGAPSAGAGGARSSRADDTAKRAHSPERAEGARGPRALPADDRARVKMPSYRVVISGGRSRARQVEFSTRAPSARGAVAAQLSDKTATVSAANEAEPADRFSWCARAACACTPVAFTDLARGGKLDGEGRCPACGVQVLPPHAPRSAAAVGRGVRALHRLRRRA